MNFNKNYRKVSIIKWLLSHIVKTLQSKKKKHYQSPALLTMKLNSLFSSSAFSPLSARKETGRTLAQISGIIQCCSSHMDLTTVQQKTAVVFFYQTTCLYLDPTSLWEINLQMTFETEVT